MNFEFDNNIPIYIQLVENIKLEIISGKLKPGDRLPSVRDLALSTKVNPNTMQKALQELENLKLIYTERTNGKYITMDEKLISEYRDDYANELSKKYFTNMETLGFSKKETIKYIKNLEGDK